MKKTITKEDVTFQSTLTLRIDGKWIFYYMIGKDIKMKSQIINATTDKFGFDKVKECIVDDFERFGNQRLYDMANLLLNNEKKVSKYMNISTRVFDIFFRKRRMLSREFSYSEQFEQLKTRIIHDVKKCRTKDQMLEMFQKDLQTPMIMAFLRYCFSERNLVTA